MTQFRSPRTAGRPVKFVPALEALEDRQLLSVTAAPFTSPTDGTWVINDDGNQRVTDTVIITDDGTSGVNNITLTVNGRSFTPGRSIWELKLNMDGGTDQITYNLARPLTSGGYFHKVEASLGAGDDTFTGNVPGLAAGSAGLHLFVWGGDNNDTIKANVSGTLASHTGLGIAFTGGQGRDNLNVDAKTQKLNMASNSLFWANISGNGYGLTNDSDDRNDLFFTYEGDMDGRIAFNMFGSGNVDTIQAELWLDNGSSGFMGDAAGETGVHGGGSDDTLTYRIHKHRNTYVGWNRLRVYGGSGSDKINISRRLPGGGINGWQPVMTGDATTADTVTFHQDLIV